MIESSKLSCYLRQTTLPAKIEWRLWRNWRSLLPHWVKIVYLWSWFDVRQQPFCRHLKLLPTLNYDALPKYNKKIFKITRNRLQRITLEFILFRMALPTLNHASYVHLCSIKHQNYSDRTHLTGIYWKK